MSMETLSAAIRERHALEGRCDAIDTALGELAARKVLEIDGYLLSTVERAFKDCRFTTTRKPSHD